jgi:hypothetical protein
VGGNARASRAENLASTRGRRGSRLFSYCRIGTRRHLSRASFGMRAKGGIGVVIVVMTINFHCVVSCWAGREVCPENAVGGGFHDLGDLMG